ncbi:MAG: glycosyltransferase family 39 protein [Clostridiales bacterium]|nr:glycosyltransferase family 39 protein [Clostridiales bacterium]
MISDIRRYLTERTVHIFSSFPYLIALLVCVVFNYMTCCSEEGISDISVIIAASLGVIISIGSFIFLFVKRHIQLRAFIAYIVYSLSLSLLFYFLCLRSGVRSFWMLVFSLILLFVLYSFADKENYKRQVDSLLILGSGFAFRAFFVLMSSIYSLQHDTGSFDSGSGGHYSYVQYLIENHHLPDFDITTRGQFYHQPLIHIINACWIEFNNKLLGIELENARECMQSLSLFFMTCELIVFYRILRHFGLKGRSLYIPLTISCFYPIIVVMSGSCNNDPLSQLLMLTAVYLLLKWVKDRSYKNIVKIALCVGFGMLTKISFASIVPAIAIVFIAVLIRQYKEFKTHIIQYSLFAAISVPLGLTYPVYNYIKWKMPFTYVMRLSDTDRQFIGDRSIWERISDFSMDSFFSVFEQFTIYGDSTNEINPFIAVLKNSLFTEYIRERDLRDIGLLFSVSKIMFWVSVIITLISVLAIISYTFFVKKFLVDADTTILTMIYVSGMVVFISGCSEYPFVCTMNSRYIVYVLLIGLVYLGIMLDHCRIVFGIIMEILTMAFAVCSALFYLYYLDIMIDDRLFCLGLIAVGLACVLSAADYQWRMYRKLRITGSR